MISSLKRATWPIVCAGTLMLTTACDSTVSVEASNGVPDGSAGAAPDGGDGDAGDAGGEPGIEWEACPLFADGSGSRMAECAQVPLPMFGDRSDGKTVSIWVQRLLSTSPTRRGQIWFLEGGPGGSGADFDHFFDEFSQIDPRWDLYTLDHRGVGLSDRLGCPEQESPQSEWGYSVSDDEWPACLQHLQQRWGEDLDAFSTTRAADDLGQLIDLTRRAGDEAFVFGVSYGTYWAIRYLQLFPDQATGVILDLIAPPGETFVSYDVFFNDVGEDLVDLCAADPFCSSKLGPEPWTEFAAAFDAVAVGGCPAFSELLYPGTERRYLRYTLATLLMAVSARPIIPAIIYRLRRCDAADGEALQHLLLTLYAGDPEPSVYDQRQSTALFNHVALSELWEPDAPSFEELSALMDTLYQSIDLAPRVASRQPQWPVYPADSYVGAWPTTATPLLMMNGDLDPQTPIWVARPAEDHFTGAYQYFFTVPRAAHAVLRQSPVRTPGSHPCGLQLMLDFLEQPTQAPGATCLSDTEPVDFTGETMLSLYLFGVADAWENDAPSSRRHDQWAPPSDLLRAVRWLRTHVPPPQRLRR